MYVLDTVSVPTFLISPCPLSQQNGKVTVDAINIVMMLILANANEKLVSLIALSFIYGI